MEFREYLKRAAIETRPFPSIPEADVCAAIAPGCPRVQNTARQLLHQGCQPPPLLPFRRRFRHRPIYPVTKSAAPVPFRLLWDNHTASPYMVQYPKLHIHPDCRSIRCVRPPLPLESIFLFPRQTGALQDPAEKWSFRNRAPQPPVPTAVYLYGTRTPVSVPMHLLCCERSGNSSFRFASGQLPFPLLRLRYLLPLPYVRPPRSKIPVSFLPPSYVPNIRTLCGRPPVSPDRRIVLLAE